MKDKKGKKVITFVEIMLRLSPLDKQRFVQTNSFELNFEWFDEVKLKGIRLVNVPDPMAKEGYDKIVIQDFLAPPLWIRFYWIGTNRPIFYGRNCIKVYSLADIEL